MKHGRAGHGVVQNGAFVVYYHSLKYPRMTHQLARLIFHKRHIPAFRLMLNDRAEWRWYD